MPATSSEYKILFVLNRIDIGGTCVNSIPLAHYLQQHYTITVAYGEVNTQQEALLYFKNQYPSLQLIPIPSLQKRVSGLSLYKAYTALQKIITAYKPNIIHTHGSLAGFIARINAASSIFYIHTYHGHLFHSYFNAFTTSIIQLIERYLAKKTHGIITLSKQQYNDVVFSYSIAEAKKVYTIALGIDSNFLQYNKEAVQKFKAQYLQSNNPITIALIGRITKIKNPFLFVDICALLQKNR